MKNFKYIGLLCLLLTSFGFAACSDDDDSGSSAPVVVKQVYLEDADGTVSERPVDFARLGQVLRIEGSGFCGLKKLYVNGYDTYFNVAYVTDNSMLVQLQSKTPVVDADPEERDKIRFVKGEGNETVYEFVIRSASPSVRYVDNTLPKAGETVTVYGANLHETSKVILPSGSEVTVKACDVDGEWYSFEMPAGETACGSITSEGANGTAVTPAYFNDNRCMILDFDGNGEQGFWSWSETGSMINDEDLVDDPKQTGRGKCLMMAPQRMLDAGGVISGKSRAIECWSAGAGNALEDWSRMTNAIPAETPVSEVALQFDIYVPNAWIGTGHIQISMINNYNIGGINSDDNNDGNMVAFYCPWIQDGMAVPFKTSGWQTVTIPFSQFNKYAAEIEDGSTPTFAEIIADRNAATYPNFGFGFVNTDFTYNGYAVEATAFNGRIYLDNWRVVNCKSIVVSDFPDEETAE